MNAVILMGNLTRDIELKYPREGLIVGNFGIAVNEGEKAHFFDVTAFNKTAETISKYFHKGSRILIEGKLNYDTWENENGRQSKVSIIVNRFHFVDRKSDNPQQTHQPVQQAQPQAAPTQPAAPIQPQAMPTPQEDEEIPF